MAIKVDDVMTRPVKTVAPETSIADAARLMFDLDAGALPVSDKGQLVGMLTDRDLAVRAVAQGLGSDTPVGKVMTINVSCCHLGEDVNHVLEEMAERKVRRMPVQNDRNQLVGIVSIGDIVASKRECHEVGHALHDICVHGGQHSQSAELSGRA